MSITQMARAKVNLTLKVVGRRQDGYHEIESLVTFAEVGDRLSWRPGEPAQVLARGPFAADIDAPNILEVAIGMLQQCAANLRLGAIELEKNLPVAAGLGGGSSDAGALLRLARHTNVERAQEPFWHAVARRLGADVPVCFNDRPALIRGIGDALQPLPTAGSRLPPLPAVLANPRVPLPTARVFEAVRAGPAAAMPAAPLPLAMFPTPQALFDHMGATGNDLEPPAMRLAPVIAQVKAALLEQPGCRVAQMSGSGPTCFGLFTGADRAAAAAAALRKFRPHWWVVATELEGVTGATAASPSPVR
jgi:4-diphosphocytidyl-2-C-methyl-D-erythritol kinase